MYPIRFEPVYQDYLWGGERIVPKYKRKPAKGRCAESWEISDRDEGMSVVSNGPFKGETLSGVMKELGEKLLGEGKKFDRFPLLLKIIDAKEHLSVQVHPDETTAPVLKGEPKTEMWFALEPSSVLAGLKKGTTREDVLHALKNKKADGILEKIDLVPQDTVFIPGGRVHAICAGSLLYEIQQNSNTTYRLYDWDRKEKERPLHVEEALSAIDWNDGKPAKVPHHHLESDLHHQLINLLSTPHFVVYRADIFDRWHTPPTAHSFQILFCIKGEGQIVSNGHKEPFHPGMTYLVPSACGAVQIEGKCEALWVKLP